MQDKIGNFSREVDIRNNLMEILQMKKSVAEIKNALDKLISKTDTVKEQ